MSEKRIRKYKSVVYFRGVGHGAGFVISADQIPGADCDQFAHTSEVVRYDETREEFETLNTIYVPE